MTSQDAERFLASLGDATPAATDTFAMAVAATFGKAPAERVHGLRDAFRALVTSLVGSKAVVLTQYLVTATADDGEDMGLFVTAASADDAVEEWRGYYDGWEGGDPKVFVVPEKAASPMAHGWDVVEEVEVRGPPNP